MEHLNIGEMNYGEELYDYYILQDIKKGKTKNGKLYLSATLSDVSGTINAKLWDYIEGTPFPAAGTVVYVEGTVDSYQGKLQVTITTLQSTTRTEDGNYYDVAALIRVAPINVDASMQYIDTLLESMKDLQYRGICEEMLGRYREAFRMYPAAKSIHHAFPSGLLMHTASMLWLADRTCENYDRSINRDLLLAGVLLHDIGKLREFELSDIGLVTAYSAQGQLLGHPFLGAEEVGEVGKRLGVSEERILLLKHLILSHHGQPEFGAAVKPACIEAELLSLLDSIDSRMAICRESLEGTAPGEFTEKVFALDRKLYQHE